MRRYDIVPLDEILAARDRIADSTVRTPLLPLYVDAPCEIYLKLENLQPIGSFKLRGACNALLAADRADLRGGIWTASAGNMAQGAAWMARRLGIPCTVVAPETAPAAKTEAVERLGARLVRVTPDAWMEAFLNRRHPGMTGFLVHAFSDKAVMAGNGTIGLEILEDLPDADAIVIPYGGGGLCCGIASAVRALKPAVRLYAAEVETAAPLKASLAAGEPVRPEYRSSFVDGIGAPMVFPEMFALARQLLNGSITASLAEVADAIRLLMGRARVVAEGAGAAPAACALAGRAGPGKVVCVISGGNIDMAKLAQIAAGEVP